MKSRIIQKKIKRNVPINLWFNSMKDWSNITKCIANKYAEDTDPNNYNEIDFTNYVIACDFLRYDWLKILEVGKKFGFTYNNLNTYFNKIF